MTDQDRRVRLLVIHPRDPAAPTQGGIQTFLHDLVKHAPPDFEVTVAGVTADRGSRPIGRRVEIDVEGRQAWSLPLTTAGRLPRNPIDIARMVRAQIALRRLMFDRRTIVQVHRPFRPIVLAGQRGPRVQFVHLDLRVFPGPSGWSRFTHLYRPFGHRELRTADRVFVVNEPGVEILKRAQPAIASRIEFLPVWFDPQVFCPALKGERQAQRELLSGRLSVPSFSADEALVLSAGRLDDNKDPMLAVEAFARLVEGGASARLLFAGEGDEQAGAAAHAVRLNVADRVHFLGDLDRDDLAALMRGIDVLLLTSRSEGGGPRVVLEALASGVPVVATPVGDVRRTVTSGVNGWLSEGRDPSELADGLSWAIAQPREKMARETVAAVAPYTAANVLTRVYEVYRELAAAAEATLGAEAPSGR